MPLVITFTPSEGGRAPPLPGWRRASPWQLCGRLACGGPTDQASRPRLSACHALRPLAPTLHPLTRPCTYLATPQAARGRPSAARVALGDQCDGLLHSTLIAGAAPPPPLSPHRKVPTTAPHPTTSTPRPPPHLSVSRAQWYAHRLLHKMGKDCGHNHGSSANCASDLLKP